MNFPAIALAVPTRGRPLLSTDKRVVENFHLEWIAARMALATPLGSTLLSLYDARPDVDLASKRNDLVYRALAQGQDAILFLGDDIIPPAGGLLKMLKRLESGKQIITGMYWTKSATPTPYVWKDGLCGAMMDWHVGDFLEIGWAGCDFLMVDMEVFKKIEPPWFDIAYKFIEKQAVPGAVTEDLYFYTRAKQEGIRAYCDTGIQCGHLDVKTGRIYELPPNYPQAKKGSDIPRKSDQIIAILGSGDVPSPYELMGDTVRIDINPANKPDVVADVRNLPDADNRYDIVSASQVLEHLPASDTPDALKEWTRVLRVGGTLDISIPNIDVAFNHILAGHTEPFFHTMIWGGCENPWAAHLNGFNPPIIRKLINLVPNLSSPEITFHGEFDWEMRVKCTKLEKDRNIIISEEMAKAKNTDRGEG